jgi:sterol desaturase/sphingolipid hydroxylase (fatty acid hydroxylase superfamily)
MLTQVLLHVLGYDIWFYVSHRLLHTRTFWWIHARHHEKVNKLQWLDAYHGHWLESTVQCAGFFLPALFGYWNWWVAALTAFAINARGLARHDERLVWLVGDYHLQHHRSPKGNYGEPWLDALCGTRQSQQAGPPAPRTCSASASDRMS